MKVKVGFIQFDVKRIPVKNIKMIDSFLENIDCEIVVLPELCICGYLFEDKKSLATVAEMVPNSRTVEIMKDLSLKYNCTIIFGMAEIDNWKIYNTSVVVDEGNYIGKYRKIHLSDFEKKLFTKGSINSVFAVRGIKIGVQICFDLWFPEISREQIRKGANLLCALANFGGETTYEISRIRAIENLTPLVLCNRVGSEKLSELDASFLGKSTVIDADGTRVINGEPIREFADFFEINITKNRGNVICKDFIHEIDFHYRK